MEGGVTPNRHIRIRQIIVDRTNHPDQDEMSSGRGSTRGKQRHERDHGGGGGEGSGLLVLFAADGSQVLGPLFTEDVGARQAAVAADDNQYRDAPLFGKVRKCEDDPFNGVVILWWGCARLSFFLRESEMPDILPFPVGFLLLFVYPQHNPNHTREFYPWSILPRALNMSENPSEMFTLIAVQNSENLDPSQNRKPKGKC